MTPPGRGLYGSQGHGWQNLKEHHCALLNTKYESSWPCGFGEEDFFMFSHCKSMGANDPRGGAIVDPRDMVGRIYKEDHYPLLHTKYESSGHFSLEKIFYVFFPMTPPGCGLYEPPGHGWQDLYRGPLYISTHKIGKLCAL